MAPITITVRNNASLAITGDDVAQVRLVDHEGNVIPTEGKKVISLCRCGASTKKPFCDGTHSKIGFKGAEEARIEFDAQQAQQQQQEPQHQNGQQPAAAAAAPTPE